MHISKPCVYIYIYNKINAFLESVHKTNPYTNIKHKFSVLVPSVLPMLKEHMWLGHAAIIDHFVQCIDT